MDINQLKDIATKLEVKFSDNIGFDTLLTRVKEYCTSNNIPVETIFPPELLQPKATANLPKLDLRKCTPPTDDKEYNKLIRCIVRCNNPDRSAEKGTWVTVGNTKTVVTKYVAFNIPYMIPQCLVTMLENKNFSKYVTKKLPNNITTCIQTQAKEYSIEYLAPMTEEEREAIKQRQLLDVGE